jgi:hypothetical protein
MAPTTAGQLMRRLNARQCRAAVAELAKIGEEVDGELGLTALGPVTLDLDSSDTEVYGRLKQGAAFNHRGQGCYDSQLATWAERRRVLAVELRSGNLCRARKFDHHRGLEQGRGEDAVFTPGRLF